VRFQGIVIAPNAEVKIDKFTEFQGALIAKKVRIDENTTIVSHNGMLPAGGAGGGQAGAVGDVVVPLPADPGRLTGLPVAYGLNQNYPNPFRMTTATRISFDIPDDVEGTVPTVLQVYDISGRLVKTLMSRPMAAGRYTVDWDGTAVDGKPMSSGVYFYVLRSGDYREMRKMVLMN